MGKVKQSVLALGLLLAGICLGVSFLVWRTGYPIQTMDWNSDGATSVSEMLDAIDIDRRIVKKNGVDCQDFFRLKDGLTVRMDCPKQ